MSFARLILIYILLGLAVFAFFKRDEILAMFDKPAQVSQEVVIEPAAPDPAPVAAPVVQPVNTPEPAAAPAPVPQAPAAAPAPLTTPVATPLTTPVATPAPPPAAQAAPTDRAAMLQVARRAYWDGEMDKAEAGYLSLLSGFPDDMDALGELGNMYYSRGKYDKAAPLFTKVGNLALDSGNRTLALSMTGILQQIAPDLAKDLQQRFDAENN